MKTRRIVLLGVALAVSVLVGPGWAPASDEIVIGMQCDRTGATQTVGVNWCPGYHDYMKLVNSKGGVEGHPIRVIEIDHEYKVPPALEGYERFKKEGAVLVFLYGTPMTYALAQKLQEDRIPATCPAFGPALAADGQRYPYLFPIAATYWSQAGGAVKYAGDRLGGLKGKKLAYLFFDNPAGREPLPVLEELAQQEGFQLRTFAVPPPGLEMGAQVLDIAQRYRADFVVTHLFGRSPSVSIKELKRVGYPLARVVAFVWGAAEADVEAAGGFGAAEGYSGLEFAGVGLDYPVLQEIRDMYKKEGKQPPKEMMASAYYNRGPFVAALHVEAIRNALKAKPGGKITGEDVRRGFEQIKGFTLGGLVPPLEITPLDHEGGGWVQVFQVKGGKFVRVTDWFRGYPEVVSKFVKEAKK
ncbi:MAG TPA: ABC transporter substrate-binding protein [Methylomirabilota bacterium]|nr:ABC transporter substrate-binding protein [Methylomirabilota bacterium]